MTNLRSPTSLFNELGLSTHAAQVFNHLLTHPDASAIEIARTLSTHKQLIYQALKELERRRLIHPYTHNRTRRYQLLNADQLMEDTVQQQEAVTEIAQHIQHATRKQRPSGTVQLFEGIDGFRTFTEQLLQETSTIELFSANLRFQTLFPQLFTAWDDQRAKKQILFRVLVPGGFTQRQHDQERHYELRRLRTNVFAGVLWMCDTAIAHALWGTQRTSQIVLIQNGALARQQRNLFEKLWKQSI